MARPSVGLMADLSFAVTSRLPIWLQRFIGSWWKVDSLRQLTLVMGGLYFATLVALFHAGLRPAVPWGLALVLPIVFVPFGIIFLYYSRQQLHSMLHVGASVGILVMYNIVLMWPIIALALLLSGRIGRVRYEWRLLFHGLLATILGYASLWNLNYLLARLMPVVHDPALRAADEWIYSWFLNSVDYTEFFPIIRNDVLLLMFNNSYMVLFSEVVLVLLLFCQTGDGGRVLRFLKGLFALYGIGILCFFVYPAIGPCLYYPKSFDPTLVNAQIIQGMLHDYHAAIQGEALMGYGYFIAVPSLHVMVALYLQRCLRLFPGLYRVFLPVNIMLVSSTVVLGYHYIVDVIIAFLIMSLWMVFQNRYRTLSPTSG